MIDPEELRAAFQTTASQMPDGLELIGVTFHGPEGQREWVAFAGEDGDPSVGCEGWGDTPLEALIELQRHIREDKRWRPS